MSRQKLTCRKKYYFLEKISAVLQVCHISLQRSWSTWKPSRHPLKGMFCGSEVCLNYSFNKSFSLFCFFSMFAKMHTGCSYEYQVYNYYLHHRINSFSQISRVKNQYASVLSKLNSMLRFQVRYKFRYHVVNQ